MRSVNCTINLLADTPVYVEVTSDVPAAIPCSGIMSVDNRLSLLFDDCIPTGGADLVVIAPGMAPWTGRITLPLQPQEEGPLIELTPGPNPFRKGPVRPSPIAHAPIAPPFDPSDADGQVHTTLPPEQVIPDHFTDPLWLRADFTGVTLDLDRWSPAAPMPLPFLVGANSTPLAMLMTPMLPLYPRYWQDADLTEHAERGYDDFVISPEPWNAAENGYDITPQQILAWCQYVKSWGFRTVIWRGSASLGLDPMLQTLLDGGVVDFYIHGKEVDQQLPSEAYDVSLQQIDAYIAGRIPIGVHFSADGARKMGYPIGFPRDTFLNDWSPYNGRVHLMQQMDVTASAGRQGSSMWYARLHVNCGIGDAARGPGAPDSRVIAFEIMSTAQLYGQCTEEYSCLRVWELLCGTRTNPQARPVSGSCSGLRYPDGSPL